MSGCALATVERDFNGLAVTLIEKPDGSLWMTRDELARCLGYAEADGIAKLVRRHEDEIGPLKGGVKLSTPGGAQEVAIYEERALYLLACVARTPQAAAFRAWVVETCRDLRTRDKVLVARADLEAMNNAYDVLMVAYTQQSQAMQKVASLAGAVLRLRQQTKPKADPRQSLLPGVVFEELPDQAGAA